MSEEYKHRKADRCHGGGVTVVIKGPCGEQAQRRLAERAQKRAAEIETVAVTKKEATV